MDSLILYFFKVHIAFIALYLFYRLFLHRDTFFKEKRLAFIFGYLFAVLHPIIHLSSWIVNSKPATEVVRTLSNTLPVILVTGGPKDDYPIERILPGMYALVAALLLLRLLWQVGSVTFLGIRGQKEKWNGQTIIHLPKGSAPFSFFGWIFINPEEHSTRDMDEILHHEKAHAHQLHTLDVLLSELVCVVFWINPFAWLLKHHLRANLEYLADRNVIHSGFDPKSYQYHLLRLSYQQTTIKVGNNFNVSQLKNRIIMMNKKRTSLAGLSKYALSLPLFALLFLSAYAWGTKQDIASLRDLSSITEKATEKTAPEQSNATITVEDIPVPQKIDEADQNQQKPLNSVEQMPQYPGGEKALISFIGKNLKYPASAAQKGIEGRVVIRFVVDQNGYVTNPEVLRGLDPACDAEGIRVVKQMPKWVPGKQKGKTVAVYFTLPIEYRLQKSNSTPPLLIVDGVETPSSYLQDTVRMNPTNFKEVSILKDSAATKIYGDKGKNGVILITTKSPNPKVTITVKDIKN